MDLLLTHALVVTCDEQRAMLEDAAVAVRGNRIVAVGPTALLEQQFPDLPRAGSRGLAIYPGFINAHTHTVLTVLRGTVEDWDGNAVYSYMSPVSYAMTPDERSAMAALGCIEAIRSGCATLVDPFRFVRDYAPAMAATGVRLWLSESCADIDTRKIRSGDYTEDRAFGEVFLDRATSMFESLHGSHDGRVRCQIAAHAPDNCSPWMLARLLDLARKHGVTRTVHLAQGLDEVRAVKAARGTTPALYLDREGWLGPDVVGAHWTYCTAEDVEVLAARGVMMAHCPANSSRRGPHRAPLGQIRRAGVRIVLGTDNMTEDMFQAMKIGLIVHRGGGGHNEDFGVDPQPGEILDWITRLAAEFCRRFGRDRLDRGGKERRSDADQPEHAGDAAADQPSVQPGALRPSRTGAFGDGGRRVRAS